MFDGGAKLGNFHGITAGFQQINAIGFVERFVKRFAVWRLQGRLVPGGETHVAVTN